MKVNVEIFQSADSIAWDEYVYNHSQATLYHLSGWKNVIEKTYGHKTYYLMATREPEGSQLSAHSSQLSVRNYELSANSYELNSDQVVGILPLVHLKHFLFGDSLISIPFFDLGGILADDDETEKALLLEAIKLGQKLKVDSIELRHMEPLSWLAHSSQLRAGSHKSSPVSSPFRRRRIDFSQFHPRPPRLSESDGGQEETEKAKESDQSSKSCLTKTNLNNSLSYATKSHKVRMLLHLPESSDVLMKSFKAKLRSQIKKPLKEGLKSRVGGVELLDDFFGVFSTNMRDLGSPVHSKRLMLNLLIEFPEESRIVIVCKDNKPLACSLALGFKDTLENPWASALRAYSHLSPNMLLYWTMLEYASDNDFRYFDFGRSSPDEGTYKFKEQWGAQPTSLHWHYISLNANPIGEQTSEKSKFDKAIRYWQKLPVPVTKVIGPMIRKHIGL